MTAPPPDDLPGLVEAVAEARAEVLREVLHRIREDERALTEELRSSENANTVRRIKARRAGLRQAAAHIADALSVAYSEGASRREVQP